MNNRKKRKIYKHIAVGSDTFDGYNKVKDSTHTRTNDSFVRKLLLKFVGEKEDENV